MAVSGASVTGNAVRMNGHSFIQATANIDDQTFPGQNMVIVAVTSASVQSRRIGRSCKCASLYS